MFRCLGTPNNGHKTRKIMTTFNNFSKLFETCVVRFLLFPVPVFSPVEMKVFAARIKNVFLVVKKTFIFSLNLSRLLSAVMWPVHMFLLWVCL